MCNVTKELNRLLHQVTYIQRVTDELSTRIDRLSIKVDRLIENKPVRSKNAETARSGFLAEDLFITDVAIKNALERYFGITVHSITKAPPRLKYDTVIELEDGMSYKIQNKKIVHTGGRGDSFDRRALEKTFVTPAIRDLIKKLSLDKQILETERSQLATLLNMHIQDDIRQYLRKTLIESSDGQMVDYIVVMLIDQIGDVMTVKNMYILQMSLFLRQIISDINIKIARTCVHLTPYIYLQRKGGGKTDHSPDDIQAKLSLTDELLSTFHRII